MFIAVKNLEIFSDIEEPAYKFTYWGQASDDMVPVLLITVHEELLGMIAPVKMDYESMIDFANSLRELSEMSALSNFCSVDGKQISIFDEDGAAAETEAE